MSLVEQCADALEAMRRATPLCECITNYVSMDIMANTLLAIGASPIMVYYDLIILSRPMVYVKSMKWLVFVVQL